MSVSVTSSETLNHASVDTEDDPKLGSFMLPPRPPLQQKPLSVRLDGTQILASALALAVLIHLVEPHIAGILVCLVPIVLYIQNDFQNYLNLGPGGTPSTFRGYLKISWLKLWAVRDPFTARGPEPNSVPSKGILAQQPLPVRMGPKPQVFGIAPHRQVNQLGSLYCYHALRLTLEKLCLKNPEKFGMEQSFIEKHGPALFARYPIKPTYQGEVCHVHDAEFSMHMCLHPDDAKEVLQKGWGQRHPLGWKWWFITNPVGADFIMVYAPRDEAELRTICKIIEGAIWYTTAEEVELDVYLRPS